MVYRQRNSRNLINHPCKCSVINVRTSRKSYSFYMYNPLRAKHPTRRAIDWKRDLSEPLIISTCCSEEKNLDVLFRACTFRFAFLHTVLRFRQSQVCYRRWYLQVFWRRCSWLLKAFNYWAYCKLNAGLSSKDRAQPIYYYYKCTRCSVKEVFWKF